MIWTTVIWLKYCRYSVKLYTINQPIMIWISLLVLELLLKCYWVCTRFCPIIICLLFLEMYIQFNLHDSCLTPEMKIKILKPYCTSTRHSQLLYTIVSFVYSLKCRWSSSDEPYMTENENVIDRPSYDPWGHAQLYPGVSM